MLPLPTDLAILIQQFIQIRLPLRAFRASPNQPHPPDPQRFIIIPADIGDPIGSHGDAAMLAGLMQALRQRHPGAAFTVIGQHNYRIDVPGIGEVPVEAAWRGIAGAQAFDRLIRTHQGLFVMGADILDGKYGAALVARIAAYCNHSVKLGIPVTFMGFSFNKTPRRASIYALARLHPDVTVNVRDIVSLARFTSSVGVPARLCADCAFLMPPAAEAADPETEAWIARQRSAGRIPVGVNLNAHAFAPVLAHTGMADLISGIANRLAQATQRHALALLLIPHDFKPESGDVRMLHALERQLRATGCAHVHYLEARRPDHIKRVVGQLDLVFTGRMHLAVAALGCGVPVLSVTYQDKFEGLYQHFGLSLDHTLRAEDCLNDAFGAKLDAALAQCAGNRALIAARLPDVQALADRNLELRTPDRAARRA